MAGSLTLHGELLKDISSEVDLQNILNFSINKLVIFFFFTQNSRTCDLIRPDIQKLSNEMKFYSFFSVDVENCVTTAKRYDVQSFPCFLFFFNKKLIEKLETSTSESVTESILRNVRHLSENGQMLDGSNLPQIPGQAILTGFIDQRNCECLNDSVKFPFKNLLNNSETYTESDCDGQLLIFLGFIQSVKLHSLCFRSPDLNYAPLTIKIFLNLSNSVDFDWAERTKPITELKLSSRDFESSNVTPLPFIKFQFVQSLTLFIKDNQGGKDTTQISFVGLFGSTNKSSSMEDFKRISGKVGESH